MLGLRIIVLEHVVVEPETGSVLASVARVLWDAGVLECLVGNITGIHARILLFIFRDLTFINVRKAGQSIRIWKNYIIFAT